MNLGWCPTCEGVWARVNPKGVAGQAETEDPLKEKVLSIKLENKLRERQGNEDKL